MKLIDTSEERFLEEARTYMTDMLKANGIFLLHHNSLKNMDEALLKIGKTYHEIQKEGEL